MGAHRRDEFWVRKEARNVEIGSEMAVSACGRWRMEKEKGITRRDRQLMTVLEVAKWRQ
jgi:RNA-binding protein YlmH